MNVKWCLLTLTKVAFKKTKIIFQFCSSRKLKNLVLNSHFKTDKMNECLNDY